MKLKAFMLLLSFSAVAHSYEPERASVNLADVLSTCAAFYTLMCKGLEKMNKLISCLGILQVNTEV